jgi:hypothetical protein
MAHYTVQDPNGLAQRRQELEQARHIAVDAMNALAQVVNRTDWRGNTATRVLGSVDQQRRDLSNLVNELDVAIGAIWPPDRQAASPVKPANLGALPVAFNTKWRDLFKFLRNKGIAV